jgi:hydrogenase nickel incorporation protein HypA/HybF
MRVAQEIISFSQKEIRERDFQPLKEIGLKVGELSCIDPESLRFAFDMLKKDTEISQAKLIIEQVNVKAVCQSCGKKFEVNDYIFICPECGSQEVEVNEGEELLITHLLFK